MLYRVVLTADFVASSNEEVPVIHFWELYIYDEKGFVVCVPSASAQHSGRLTKARGSLLLLLPWCVRVPGMNDAQHFVPVRAFAWRMHTPLKNVASTTEFRFCRFFLVLCCSFTCSNQSDFLCLFGRNYGFISECLLSTLLCERVCLEEVGFCGRSSVEYDEL